MLYNRWLPCQSRAEVPSCRRACRSEETEAQAPITATDRSSMKKAAIVFGGAGFIGSHFLRTLAQRGHYARLHSVDIAPPRLRVEAVDYINFDVRNPVPPSLCGLGPFDLFNFAAVHTTPGHADWEYY